MREHCLLTDQQAPKNVSKPHEDDRRQVADEEDDEEMMMLLFRSPLWGHFGKYVYAKV